MSLPTYTPLVALPETVAAFEARIPVGTSSCTVTTFKASLIRAGSARIEGDQNSFTVAAGDMVLMRPEAFALDLGHAVRWL